MNVFVLKYKRGGKVYSVKLDRLQKHEDRFVSVEFHSIAIQNGNKISVVVKPKMPVVLEECHLTFDMIYDYVDITTNGYQSASNSSESRQLDKSKKLGLMAKLFALREAGFYKADKHFEKGSIISHTYIQFLSADGRNARFYGSINEENAFTFFGLNRQSKSVKIASDVRLRNVEDTFTLMEFIITEGNVFDLQNEYAKYFKTDKDDALKNIYMTAHQGSGSRYVLTERQLSNELLNMKKYALAYDAVIINEGYEMRLGDWQEVNRKHLPGGMKNAADLIKNSGYRPGISFSPFVAEKRSRLFRMHSDWFLPNVLRFKHTAGYNPDWGGKFYVLDFYKPQVQEYLRELLKTMMYEWGFEVFYIDTLYAAAVEARVDRTRAEIMRDVFAFFKEVCRDKIVIAAGTPIGAAFGETGYCKIAPDNAPFWEDKVLKMNGYNERISTANMLETLVARRYLNESFNSVASAYFIGSKMTKLSLFEKNTLLTWSMLLASTVITSDEMQAYDDIELSLLRKIFPKPQIKRTLHLEEGGIHTFEFRYEEVHYLVVTNLSTKAKDYLIPKGIFCGKFGALLPGGCLLNLKSRQTQVLVKIDDVSRPVQPIYSQAHLLPLFEIGAVEYRGQNRVNLIFKGEVSERSGIYLMANTKTLIVNGQECRLVQEVGQKNVFLFEPANMTDNLEEFVIDVVKVEVPAQAQLEEAKEAREELEKEGRIEGQLSFEELVRQRSASDTNKDKTEIGIKQPETDKWEKHVHTSQTMPVDIIQKREEAQQPITPQEAKEGKIELSREEVSEILRASIEQAMELEDFEEFDV